MKPDSSNHNPDPRYLRGLRAQTGMPQQSLADALGLSRRTVQNYEKEGAPRWYALAVERLIQVIEGREND